MVHQRVFLSHSHVCLVHGKLRRRQHLMTVMFLHARGSVLLAIVMHWSIVPGKEIARISFSAAPEPPDWLRAGVFLDALHWYGTVMSFAFLVNAILYGLVIFGAMTTISALTAKNFER